MPCTSSHRSSEASRAAERPERDRVDTSHQLGVDVRDRVEHSCGTPAGVRRLAPRAVKLAAAIVAMAGCAAVSLAQGPPAMPDITFPVDTASIGTKLAAAGATVLLIVFLYKVGFGYVKALFSKVFRSAKPG